MNNQEKVESFLNDFKNNSRPIKVVISGSREFTDYKLFTEILNDLLDKFPDFEIISGKATSGPDLMGIEYSKEHGILCHLYPADWNNIGVPNARIKTNSKGRQYNANAGHDRNLIMAEACDFYIVFWDGKSPGTKNMLSCLNSKNKVGVLFMV
jgi:hypothetical protein